jgi:hypothetical protein
MTCTLQNIRSDFKPRLAIMFHEFAISEDKELLVRPSLCGSIYNHLYLGILSKFYSPCA